MGRRVSRPNVLVIMADQLGTHGVPAYGNGIVDAPNLSALARDGVVFDSAYCPSPICAPSRASMLTGQLPSRIGAFDNGTELPASVPTLAHYLRGAGYRTATAGKMHFVGPDQLHGFEDRLTTDVYPAGLDWTPDWSRGPQDRLPWYHDMSSVLGAGVSEATLQLDFDEEVGFRSVRHLFDLARSEDRRPFFFLVSFIHPHDPWEVPRTYWDRYEGVPIDLPSVPRIPNDELDPHSARLRSMCGGFGLEVTDDMVRTVRRAYYAAVSYVDGQIGRVLRALETTGLRDETIVIVTADHGEMLGERGLWYKMTFFEDSARVPLIVNAPGRFGPGRVARNVSLVDLVPTVMELVGAGAAFEPADPIDGTSLVPLLGGGEGAGQDTALGEYLAEGAVAPIVMIRRGPHKFIHCPADPDQLFDLPSDPHELTNLAEDPAHAGVVRGFQDEVASLWDLDELHRAVVASQRRRRLIVDALSVGRNEGWDYRPPDDSSARYVRGQDFWEPFAGARLPGDGESTD
jgi:choline-sulfatase